MQTFVRASHRTTVGCEELGRAGLIDTSGCCEICHSADEQPLVGALGPCRAPLPDGREARVCCAGKKQLLKRRTG